MADDPIDENAPITLEEAARRMFPPDTVDADGLKRLIRRGKLRAYKPGKRYLTTIADMRAMIEATRVQKPRSKSSSELNIERSSDALAEPLAKARALKRRR